MSRGSSTQAWARGGTIFAATMMLIIGIYQIFIGIVAIAQRGLVVVGDNYTYTTNTTAWGWIHLGIGVLAAIAGFFLFTGATWARGLAIALAAISALANFFFLVYTPIWSLVIIALDIFVIWAIANARSPREEMGYRGADAGTGSYGGEMGAKGNQAMQGERWPSDNQSSGRHWAPDTKPAEAGQGQGMSQGQGMGQMGESAEQARERAAASARPSSGQNPSQYPGGPQNPQGPYQPPQGG